MKRPVLLVVLSVVILAGAYLLGWSTGSDRTVPSEPSEDGNVVQEIIYKGPDFESPTPYMDWLFKTQECENVSVADDASCAGKLMEDILIEADELAERLILEAPLMEKSNGVKGFAESLIDDLKKSKEIRDEYVDSTCSVDMSYLAGGSGSSGEFYACKYYYTKQYLETLKRLQSPQVREWDKRNEVRDEYLDRNYVLRGIFAKYGCDNLPTFDSGSLMNCVSDAYRQITSERQALYSKYIGHLENKAKDMCYPYNPEDMKAAVESWYGHAIENHRRMCVIEADIINSTTLDRAEICEMSEAQKDINFLNLLIQESQGWKMINGGCG